MTDRQTEALRLALEALENSRSLEPVDVQWVKGKRHAAITAIREALAEPPAQQQEPVAWIDICEKGQMSGLRYWSEPDNRHEVPLYTSPPTQQQKPVACKTLCELCVKRGYHFCANAAQTTLIPSPPASKPLTDEQLEMMWRAGPFDHGTLYDFILAARATEAAHGIKGDA